jgi:prevent-host-death family protein
MKVVTAGSTAGVRELRDHLSRYLAEVRRGREVVVTDHGRPVARLVPPDAAQDRLAELIAAGRAQGPRRARRPPSKPIKASGTVSDLVRDQRR